MLKRDGHIQRIGGVPGTPISRSEELQLELPPGILEEVAPPSLATDHRAGAVGSRSRLNPRELGDGGRRARNLRDKLRLSKEYRSLQATATGDIGGLVQDCLGLVSETGQVDLEKLRRLRRQVQLRAREIGSRKGQGLLELLESALARLSRRNAPGAFVLGGAGPQEFGALDEEAEAPEAREGAAGLLDRLRAFFLAPPPQNARQARKAYDAGLAALEAGRSEEALAHLREAASLLPDEGRIQRELGRALTEEGYFPEAEWAYQQALMQAPGDPQVSYLLGDLYYQTGQPELAEESFKQAVSLNPRHTDAQTQLGMLEYETGRLEAAAARLTRAVQLDQENVTARFYLLQISLQKNDTLRARYQIAMLRRLDPDLDLGRFMDGRPVLANQTAPLDFSLFTWALPRGAAPGGTTHLDGRSYTSHLEPLS